MKIPYKRRKVNSGDLRTPVTFYEQTPNDDGEPGNMPTVAVFDAWAQVYGASEKDRTYLSTNDKSEAVTIKIRDPGAEFVPRADTQTVSIDDYRYQNKDWNIKNVRPDFENNEFIVIVLEYTGGAANG